MKRFLYILPLLVAAAGLHSCMEKAVEDEPVRLSVDIYESDLSLVQGDTYQLTLVVEPSDVEYSSVEWTSLNPEIVSVTQEGMVTAENTGEALIKVTVDGVSATSIVTVGQSPLKSVGFAESEYEVVLGETVVIGIVFEPSSADTSGAVWTSSDSSVVMPVGPGEFKGLSIGESFVTVNIAGKAANCKIRVVQGAIKPGDFLFDDGSVCSVLLPGKYPVAVVFYAGNPTAEDAALKAEHPKCTHGLAVSIGEDLTSAWQPAYSACGKTVGDWCDDNSDYESPITGTDSGAPLNRICGYNNTMALLDFNSDLANRGWKVAAAVEYCYYIIENGWSLPEGTSGWYIPSAKEMSLLVRGVHEGNIWDIQDDSSPNLDIVNASIGKIRPDCVITGGSYWTSSEYDESYAYFVNASGGRASIAPKNFENGLLRFIVAF